MWSTGEHEYTSLYTWCLKCADGQFFTPRYLHTLFIQLVKFGNNEDNTKHEIWKNGIFSVAGNGARFMLEVTEQTTLLQFSIQCMVGCEQHLPKQRSTLISLIKSLKKKVCRNVQVKEYLLHSHQQYLYEIPIQEVALGIVQQLPCVTVQKSGLHQVKLTDLFFFDPFYQIDKAHIQDIF